jgi:hypothetical protein
MCVSPDNVTLQLTGCSGDARISGEVLASQELPRPDGPAVELRCVMSHLVIQASGKAVLRHRAISARMILPPGAERLRLIVVDESVAELAVSEGPIERRKPLPAMPWVDRYS